METDNNNSEPKGDDHSGRNIWLRGLFMLFFIVAFGIGEALIIIVTIVQFFWLLITGKFNQYMVRFGHSLSKWIADIVRFQTGVTEEKPFPWSKWPN